MLSSSLWLWIIFVYATTIHIIIILCTYIRYSSSFYIFFLKLIIFLLHAILFLLTICHTSGAFRLHLFLFNFHLIFFYFLLFSFFFLRIISVRKCSFACLQSAVGCLRRILFIIHFIIIIVVIAKYNIEKKFKKMNLIIFGNLFF